MDWQDADTTHCGVAATAEIIGDRWALLILREISFGLSRYGDILDHVGVSNAVLTDRLKRLTDCGILTKVAYQQEGRRRRYEYQLTERGKALLIVQAAMAEFGYTYLIDDDKRLVSLTDRATGQAVIVALVREDGAIVDPETVEAHINEHVASRST